MMNTPMTSDSQLASAQHMQQPMQVTRRQWAAMPAQHDTQLEVPRTRNPALAQSPFTTNVGASRSATHGDHITHSGMSVGRSMTNISMMQNVVDLHHSQHNIAISGHGGVQHPDFSMMQTGNGNEAMYID